MITLENAYENDGSDDDIVEDMYTWILYYFKCFSIVFAFKSKIQIYVR